MSFLASHQRPYDSLSHPDVPQQPPVHPSHPARLSMHAMPAYDSLPLPPFSTTDPMLSNPALASLPDRPHIALPRVGETRCYWSLLTSDLTFLYLDPVLASHLGPQADLLVGKSLLTYVHPDEQASAKVDLGAVLESQTLHGSVTRVRYSRLSRVRRQLGYNGPATEWTDADKVSVDADYMAVDIVINYAADGLVLCFMHAVVDLTPRDNDEHNKTCWTNWCGTPVMSVDDARLLYTRLSTLRPPQTIERVFQILLNQPGRPLCLSWPEDRHGDSKSKELARLAEEVQISNSSTDAKTSCTRRYKACQVVDFSMGDKREVESIFIPHGAIIFACHKITSYPRSNVVGGGGLPPPLGYHSSHYGPPPNAQYYDPRPQSLPHNQHVPSLQYDYAPQSTTPMSSSYPPNPWANMEPSGSPTQYAQWGPSSLPNAPISSLRSSSYSAPPAPGSQHQWQSQQQQPPYIDTESPVSSAGPSAPSPGGLHFPASGPSEQEEQPPPSPPNDVVPAPRSGRRSNREQYSNGGRTAGNPPVGVTKCASCKATHSPEWRKGPSGKKDLCNACGLRFARSRAKKEGNNQRRRKDRAMSTLSVKPEPSPSASPVSASYPTMRRGSYFEESSFLSTSSAGSGSGNDSFSHAASFDGMTPSPSPPSGGMHYVHGSYNPPMQAEGRPPAFGAHPNPNQYYHLPPPQQNLQQPGMPPPMPNNGHLPHARLDPIVPFPNRLSPLVSPSSPVSNSPLSASLSAASYERDKRYEREPEHAMMQSPFGADPSSYRMKPHGYVTREGPY